MSVLDLLKNEEFFNDNCVVIGDSKATGYKWLDDRIVLDENIIIDEMKLTSVFEEFSIEINGSIYAGGDASSHGSCGFFYKKTNERLDWALMTLEFGPFIGVEHQKGKIVFLTSSDKKWIVEKDDLTCSYIERMKV